MKNLIQIILIIAFPHKSSCFRGGAKWNIINTMI